MIKILEADLSNSQHAAAVLALTRSFVLDPMGGGTELPATTEAALIEGLRRHPTTLVFLAFDDERPVGIATCFLGFSTFAARNLINVHDLHVTSDCRGEGLGRRLLQAVEDRARELDCCKLTLEVQDKNHVAQSLYQSVGFKGGEYDPESGTVLFREKKL